MTRLVPRASRAAAIVAILLVVAAARVGAQPAASTRADQARLHEVVTAERAFAKLSMDRGMKAAFLAYLADSGVIFRPTAVNGKQAWTASENPKSSLFWEPAYAEVAFSGDLAVSTGPWRMTFPPGEKRAALHGRFLSMWRREEGGSWKVEADIGIGHEAPWRPIGATTLSAGPVHEAPGPLRDRRTPGDLDTAIGLASANGIGRAYRQMVTGDFRLLRDGRLPDDRPADALAALDSLAGRFEFLPERWGAARAQDLAYSYGLVRRSLPDPAASPDTSVYFHVWRRNPAGWRVAIAVLNPLR